MELEGSYNLGNVAAAVAIGAHFGVSWEQAQRALSAYVPTNHRSQTVVTDDNWVLLDAYNANPSSMAHAVNDFAKRNHEGRWPFWATWPNWETQAKKPTGIWPTPFENKD